MTKNDQNEQIVSLTISNQTFFRLAILIIGTIGFMLALKQAAHALLLIFTALLLALALNTPVHFIASRIPGKKRGSRAIATSISYFTVLLLLGIFIASFTPPLVTQSRELLNSAPALIKDLHDQNTSTGKFVRQYNLEKPINDFSNQLATRIGTGGGAAYGVVSRIGTSIFAILTILVLAFMMLVEGPRWINFIKGVVPRNSRKTMERLLYDMHDVIKGFVNGQVILALIASILILPALLVLHIGYPLALMMVIFICGLIPMVGHTIGAIIVTTVALFTSPFAGIAILVYYISYQQLENIFVQPKIQANSTNMSPLLVFMAIIVGVGFGGIFGGIIAIPVAGCLRILFLEILRYKKIISNQKFETIKSDSK
ncbi:MAG: AI-2E family transporter [bacterium]